MRIYISRGLSILLSLFNVLSQYYKEKVLIIRVNLYNLELLSGEIVKSNKVDLEKKHIEDNVFQTYLNHFCQN